MFKEEILLFAGKNFVAVAHIRIDHLVLDIGPGKGNIAAGKCVIESDRILGRSKGHQYFDIRAVVRSWYPAVPLVDRRLKTHGQPSYCWMCWVINGQRGWQRRPAGAVEDGAKKVGEPLLHVNACDRNITLLLGYAQTGRCDRSLIALSVANFSCRWKVTMGVGGGIVAGSESHKSKASTRIAWDGFIREDLAPRIHPNG